MLVSDMMASGLTKELRKSISLWASCIAGALELDEYLNKIRSAGFNKVEVVNKEEYSREFIKDAMESAIASSSEGEQKATSAKVKALHRKYSEMFDIKVLHADIRATKN
jgi:hypothetical protein